MGENNLNKIEKSNSKSKKKGANKSEESSTGESISDPKKTKKNKMSKDKKKASSLKENDPDFETDSSIEEPDEYSSESSESAAKKRRPTRRRTHQKYTKKKKDNFNVLAEVKKNIDGTGPYKTLRPGGNGGITHEIPYKFETKHYTSEKRTSKPTAHFIAQQKGKSPRKKTTPSKKRNPRPLKTPLDDIPAPPERSVTELDDMTTKQKLLEAKSLYEGPCTKTDLLNYFKRHYHVVTNDEMMKLLDRCVEKKELVRIEKGNFSYYLLPKEHEEQEPSASSSDKSESNSAEE